MKWHMMNVFSGDDGAEDWNNLMHGFVASLFLAKTGRSGTQLCWRFDDSSKNGRMCTEKCLYAIKCLYA